MTGPTLLLESVDRKCQGVGTVTPTSVSIPGRHLELEVCEGWNQSDNLQMLHHNKQKSRVSQHQMTLSMNQLRFFWSWKKKSPWNLKSSLI